jgi:hypothetical protein
MSEGVSQRVDQCQVLRDRLQDLQDQLDTLESASVCDLTPAEKTQRGRQIQFVRKQIRDTEVELRECEKWPPSGVPGLRVFGSEVNQGLPGYELVAAKDTLVRVLVGAISSERPAMLDYAALEVRGPEKLDFRVQATMSGSFSNVTQSYSESNNVNFYIDGNQLSAPGLYSFRAIFYRYGGRIAARELGERTFHITKPLRILVVVDEWPMRASSWDYVRRALRYVNRDFPIASGIGPLDGSRSVGLRYAVDPTPFNYDQDFPIWKTAIERLNRFNAEQAGRPDRADHILIVREQQPGEPSLGGTAHMCGNVAGAVLNWGADYFATIIAQEIGHNYCLQHSPNAIIAEPAAFDLLNRRAILRPMPLMYNPVGPDQDTMLEVTDWDSTLGRLTP